MTTMTRSPETRLLAGTLLFAFAIASLILSGMQLPTVWPLHLNGLPRRLAILTLYCACTVIACSLVDRVDREAAVGAYRLLGRWFYWLGGMLAALVIGLATTRSNQFGDLLDFRQSLAALGLAAALFAVFAYLSLRPASVRRAPVAASGSRLKTMLAVMLCLVAGIMLKQRYDEKRAWEDGYEVQDAAERRAAKPWSHDLNAFPGGMSVAELQAMLKAGGHTVRCHHDLRSENRIQEDDKANCWTILGVVWGIPARMTAFAFGEHGLRNQLLRFPESSWPLLEQKLDQMGQRLPQTFGLDPDTRQPVYGWRTDSGLIFSAAPAPGMEITVLWTAKMDVARDHCRYQGGAAQRDPRGYSIPVKALWPDIDCSRVR